MRTIKLGASNLDVPVIATGCMRLGSLSPAEAEKFIRTSIELGANFFDHADIYGRGKCETLFSESIKMNSDFREKIILQSKCGIVPGKMYNMSKEYILSSVDGILQRLKTDYLDVLLLHRPDALTEPEEVAEAFSKLRDSGKVRHFGVSNHKSSQIKLLQKYLNMPIVANQLQLSIPHANMITNGMCVNMTLPSSVDYDDSVLDFCRLENITIQAWSPFQYGFFEGVFIGNDKFPKLNEKLIEIASKYGVTPTTIATAWILRHPAKIQVVCGTMNTVRLAEICKASEIQLTRDEWYEIYLSAGHPLP